MKKSLLAVLVAGILLISAGAFAGTITISQIPDVIVVNDGNPGGTRGDNTFAFSEAFQFANYVGVEGGASTEPITLSYIVTGESGSIDPETVVTLEGVAHPTTVDGNGETAAQELGTVTALDADTVLGVEYAAITTYDSLKAYAKQIKILGASGDTNPGSGNPFTIDIEPDDGANIDRFSGGLIEVETDSFTSDAEGWVYTAVLGSTTESSTGGELKITYNAIDSYSYWQRPPTHADPLPAWKADTLYLVEADVTTSVTSTTVGDINDFRLFLSDDASAALNIFLILSQFSDGGSNYISPTTSGVTYRWPVEPNVLSGNSNNPLIQFEGYNIAGAGRSNRTGTSVAMQEFRLYEVPVVDANGAGTAVVTLDDSTELMDGGAWGWSFEPGTATANVGLTGAASGGTLTLTMATAPAAGQYAYGSWTTTIFNSPTSTIDFVGQTLYRLTYKVTTTTIASGANHIVPVARVNTGDFHLTTGLGLYPGFGTNKVLTSSLSTTPDIDLWFYYQGATRTSGGTPDLMEDSIFPSFEGQVPGPIGVPAGNVLTLSEIAVTEHGSLP